MTTATTKEDSKPPTSETASSTKIVRRKKPAVSGVPSNSNLSFLEAAAITICAALTTDPREMSYSDKKICELAVRRAKALQAALQVNADSSN